VPLRQTALTLSDIASDVHGPTDSGQGSNEIRSLGDNRQVSPFAAVPSNGDQAWPSACEAAIFDGVGG
jgi:hypothetical protein